MIDNLVIQNPKRTARVKAGRASWYPYYAGFCSSFSDVLLSSASLAPEVLVLDTWNGTGTTTESAGSLGYIACGYDLNPVMFIAAKARLLSRTEVSSIRPLAHAITLKA